MCGRTRFPGTWTAGAPVSASCMSTAHLRARAAAPSGPRPAPGEDGSERVAGEGGDLAARCDHVVDEDGEVPVQQPVQALAPGGPGGGQRLTERGEAGQVGEQDDAVEVLGHRQTAVQTGWQRPESPRVERIRGSHTHLLGRLPPRRRGVRHLTEPGRPDAFLPPRAATSLVRKTQSSLPRNEVIDMTTSRPRRARYRPWLVAAMASSAVLVPAMTATATWQNSSITLVEFRDVCRDGVRFGGAVRVGTADNDPQYKTMAVVAQPPPAAWADKPALAMRTAIKIPRLPAPEDIVVDDDPNNVATVSHLGSFTLRYAVAALDLAPMALNIQDGDPQSSVNTADVTDCYLFAPIDVVARLLVQQGADRPR